MKILFLLFFIMFFCSCSLGNKEMEKQGEVKKQTKEQKTFDQLLQEYKNTSDTSYYDTYTIDIDNEYLHIASGLETYVREIEIFLNRGFITDINILKLDKLLSKRYGFLLENLVIHVGPAPIDDNQILSFLEGYTNIKNLYLHLNFHGGYLDNEFLEQVFSLNVEKITFDRRDDGPLEYDREFLETLIQKTDKKIELKGTFVELKK